MRLNTLLAALAAGIVVPGLAACGNDKATSKSTDSGSSKASNSNYSITLIPGIKTNPFYISMSCGAQNEAKKLGATLKTQGANEFAAPKQIPVVNAVTASKPDAVLIAPTDAKALVRPMLQMKSRGIKLIEVDTKTDQPDLPAARVSSDNVQGGEAAADELAREIGAGGGEVLVISLRPGVSTDDLRVEGFKKGVAKHPELKLISVQYNDEKPEKAQSIVNATLASHPRLKGIFTTDFFGAQGAGTALKGAKMTGKVKIVTFDATTDQVKALKEGLVQAIVSQSPYQQGVLGVQRAVTALKGGKPQPSTLLPTRVVTKDNIDDPATKQYIYSPSC